MAKTSCLGLYIEENLIKYAKVSKEQEKIKVDAFGIKFYDKLGSTIEQVVEETYSQRIPISVNLSEEMYNYFDMFSLLNKNDLQKAIKTEFESYCTDRGYNPNVFETRYAVVENFSDKNKVRAIHIAENKIELNKRIQQIDNFKLANISPISVSIPNLIDTNKKENVLIVNMEDKTTLTTVLQNKIYNVEIIDEGSYQFLSKINLKENSYSKAYEICKNTTIYTSEGKELQQEETAYLEDIMPTLYSIVMQTQKTVNMSAEKISKVYITGTATLINNIDLYFQEYLTGVDCEILRPYFIENTKDISIKDYIEVNTAISLALMGINEGISGMNFKAKSISDRIPDWLKIDVNPEKTKKEKKNAGGFFTWDLGQALDNTEKNLIRVTTSLLFLFIVYSFFSAFLGSQINNKKNEAQTSIDNTKAQIAIANSDNEKIKTKTNNYISMIKSLEEANQKLAERNRRKNAIPNLLNQIMSVVPENVQLTSIDNTSDSHIVINAQSDKYEQLGYLKAKIKLDVILTNVISTAGQKDNNVVTVKIEGDLP